ncbi:hypothetical protein BDZ97DRAFT_1760689 [Flammula alnicola]|nr:hypothetical protein BDZ97DRAFT_1760689 [Flammula alnicola]
MQQPLVALPSSTQLPLPSPFPPSPAVLAIHCLLRANLTPSHNFKAPPSIKESRIPFSLRSCNALFSTPFHPQTVAIAALSPRHTVSATGRHREARNHVPYEQSAVVATAMPAGGGGVRITSLELRANRREREVAQTPTSAATSGTGTTPTGTMYTPTSTLQMSPTVQTPVSPPGIVGPGGGGVVPVAPVPAVGTPQPPPAAMVTATTPTPMQVPQNHTGGLPKNTLPARHPPTRPALLASGFGWPACQQRNWKRQDVQDGVERMPVIPGSEEGPPYDDEDEHEEGDGDKSEGEGYETEDGEMELEEEEEEEGEGEEEYNRKSLHADSSVTAGTNEDEAGADGDINFKDSGHRSSQPPNEALEQGVELVTLGKKCEYGATGSVVSGQVLPAQEEGQ